MLPSTRSTILFSIYLISVFLLVSINATDTPARCSDTNLTGDQMRPLKLASQSNNSTKTKRHLVLATLESPPFVMRQPGEGRDSVEWYGYCIDFFNELIKHLPYEVTYEIYQVEDNKFGSKDKRSVLEKADDRDRLNLRTIETWNGLVGDLHKKKAHIALAPLAVMAERELAIDFTVPFYDLVGIQILMKRPEVPQEWFKFLTVLDKDVWLSIALAYFITSFVIFLFDRLSPYSHKNVTRIRKLRREKMSGTQPDKTLDKTFYRSNQNIYSTHMNTEQFDNRGNNIDKINAASGVHGITKRRRSSLILAMMMPGSIKHNSVAPLKVPPGPNTINFRANSSENTQEHHTDIADDGKPDFGIKDSLWFCITSLTPQGGGEAPQNLSGRIVAGAWWLFCFIVIASYTANLAAFLTVSRLDIPIDSLDDLAKQYRIKYAPVNGTAEQTYFERMAYIEEIFYNIWKEMSLNDSLSEEERSKFAVWDYPISDKYTKIWAQIQEVTMPADIGAGVERVKKSNLDDGFALLADANTVRYAVMTDCGFKSVGDEFSRKPIALGIQKGQEQLREDISYAILQLINRRFMEVLREKWWTNNQRRVICDKSDESEGISVENIGGVFIIILVGIVLSFCVWAVEQFIYKTKIEVSRHLIDQT